MTNINIKGEIKENEVIRVIVTYGKAEAYVRTDFVKGDAFNQYVEEVEKQIADRGWTKDVNIKENCDKRDKIWNGNGNYSEICCYTKEGVKYNYKIA